jgi:RNA-directed DNA polymerase
MIEDFFDPATKATTVDGKVFDPTEEKDLATHYGKTIFAHKVVVPSAKTIDFSAFQLILNNLVALLLSHAKKFPA